MRTARCTGSGSSLLRAIRAGAIHIQHGATVLAHYGCLEVAFDTCSKVIVDILQEERIMVEKPELVTFVVTQTIQEVFWFLPVEVSR